jgi:hypothetical protein
MLHFDVEPRVGYLYVTLTGELAVASAQASMRELLAIAARQRQPRMLIDCARLSGGDWTPDDRYAFGSFLATEVQRVASQFPAFPRIAIYAVAPLMDPNRYTQTVANNRGAQVRASDSLQELLSWLGV